MSKNSLSTAVVLTRPYQRRVERASLMREDSFVKTEVQKLVPWCAVQSVNVISWKVKE